MFTLGPRVFIDYADLSATGLLEFASRVRRQILVRVDEEKLQELVWDLEGALANEFVRVRSYKEAGDQLARRLNRGESYLSLAGLVILILGGVGVWSVVRVFVAQKLPSIAVLKCVGATTRQVLGIYVAQVLFLSVTGCLLGLGLARLVVLWIPLWLGLDLKDVTYGLTLSSVLQGIAIGLLVSILFSLIPLLHVRRVRPLSLLRPEGLALRAAPEDAPRAALRARPHAARRGGSPDPRSLVRRFVASGVVPHRSLRLRDLRRPLPRSPLRREPPHPDGGPAFDEAPTSRSATPSST